MHNYSIILKFVNNCKLDELSQHFLSYEMEGWSHPISQANFASSTSQLGVKFN